MGPSHRLYSHSVVLQSCRTPVFSKDSHMAHKVNQARKINYLYGKRCPANCREPRPARLAGKSNNGVLPSSRSSRLFRASRYSARPTDRQEGYLWLVGREVQDLLMSGEVQFFEWK